MFFAFRPQRKVKKKQILCDLCVSAVIINYPIYNTIPYLRIRVLSAQDSSDLWKSEQRHHEELSQILPLNKTTEKVFKDTDAHRNLIRCEDADDMFQKLGI